MEQMLALYLLVLHGACAAALPAPSQGHQDLEFHEDLTTGTPLTMIVGKDLKRILTETDQLPGTHKDLGRHERHDRPKPKAVSVLDQVVDEVLQDPDDTELRNAVSQLIKEVENRHAKKHRNIESEMDVTDVLKSAVNDQTDSNNDNVDTHDDVSRTNHNSNLVMLPKPNSEVIHFVSRNGGRQGHNDAKPTGVDNSSSNPHNGPDMTASDNHGSNELLLSHDRLSNLSKDLNKTIVNHQVETPTEIHIEPDLRNEDQQVERTLIDNSNSNEDPSFKSWGSDDYNDQYLKGDDDEYDDLIDLRESKESVHFTESSDVGSYVNSNNNDNVFDRILNYNDEDIDLRDGNNNEIETKIADETPQHAFNSNLTRVSINDLLHNNLEAATPTPSSNNSNFGLSHVLTADTPILDNSHANDSLRAGTSTDNKVPEPETGAASTEFRQAKKKEIDQDTDETHHHHSHSKDNGDKSKDSRDCRGHNKIYSLSFSF